MSFLKDILFGKHLDDKDKFKKMLKSSYCTDHSWLKIGGPAEKYAKVMVDLKVLKPEVLDHAA